VGGEAPPGSSPDRILFPATIWIDLKAEKCYVFIKMYYRSRNTFFGFCATRKTQLSLPYYNYICQVIIFVRDVANSLDPKPLENILPPRPRFWGLRYPHNGRFWEYRIYSRCSAGMTRGPVGRGLHKVYLLTAQ